MSDQDRPQDDRPDEPTWPGSDTGGDDSPASPGTGGPPPPPPPPDAPPPPPGPAGGTTPRSGETVDVGQRFLARLIDHVLLWVVSLVIVVPVLVGAMVSDASVGSAFGMGFSAANLVSGILIAAIEVGYFTYLESSRGQTLGKQLMNIRTVGPDGGNPTVEQAFRRNSWYLLAIVPVIGPLAQLVVVIVIAVSINSDPANRGKHDEFAGGTAVVRA